MTHYRDDALPNWVFESAVEEMFQDWSMWIGEDKSKYHDLRDYMKYAGYSDLLDAFDNWWSEGEPW